MLKYLFYKKINGMVREIESKKKEDLKLDFEKEEYNKNLQML